MEKKIVITLRESKLLKVNAESQKIETQIEIQGLDGLNAIQIMSGALAQVINEYTAAIAEGQRQIEEEMRRKQLKKLN
jgi:hypothetical protein